MEKKIYLPDPSESIFKYLNEIFFEFVWQGPAKIKKEVIIKNYCKGGLQMINIKAFVQSLNISWVKRLVNKTSQWQSLINHSINFNNIINFGPKYTESILKDIPNLFWKDVFKAYIHFLKYNKIMNESIFLSSPIHYNPNIVVGGKEVFYQGWYKKGIYLVNDLIKENGDFYNITEFNQIYNVNANFLIYEEIERAIKEMWKNITLLFIFSKKLSYPIIPYTINELITTAKGSNHIYNILNTNSTKPP